VGKNVKNSTRFRTTSDFDGEFFWNGWRYRKSEKIDINYNPPTFSEKNDELWSTNKKVIGAQVDPPTINTARGV